MTTVTLAERLRHVEDSPTLGLAAKAKALAAAGRDVLDFTAGEPDLPTPEAVKRAGIAAIEANHTTYTPVAGIPALRKAIAEFVNRSRGTRYEPAQTMATCGTKHALFNIFQALCNPGDEVIVLAPYWVSFPALVHLSGARPVIVPTRKEDGFLPDPAAVRAAVTAATRAIIINSPSNPTGTVIDAQRLEALGRLAKEQELCIISDEIYDQLVYPPARHASILQVMPELAEQTILVGGVSKSYSMTGWRLGYALGPKPWIEAMIRLQSHSTSNPTSISQYAALAALTGDQRPVEAMRGVFQRRRDALVKGLNALSPLSCRLPDGAFYAWCDVSGLKQPAAKVADAWLEEMLVATVPGDGFGAPDFIRFSFAASDTAITQGLERLRDWLLKREGAQ